MTYEVSVFSVVYLLAALMCAAAAPFAWKRRSAPGFLWLFLMLAAMVEWNLVDSMEQSVVELNGHLFWSRVSYFGSTTLAVFLLLFAMEYTGRNKWINRRSVAALFVLPAVSVIGAFTNWHNLNWTSVTLASSAEDHLYVYHHGPLYFLIIIYSFVLLSIATVALVKFALRNRNLYRYQSTGIIVAIIIPWAAEILYDLAPGFYPGHDRAAVLAVSGVILTFCIVRLRLLDLAPVAREALVESMSDGVLVLDSQSRVVDYNPAALRLFSFPANHVIGKSVGEALASWPELAERLICTDAESAFDIISPDERHLSLRMTALRGKKGQHTGCLAIFRDISSLKETESELKRTAHDLQLRLSEIEILHAELREQAIRDPLTTLYNRRFLQETLAREFGRASREDYPVCLVMIDIDGFKAINDQDGHAAGDLVLRSFGKRLRSLTRLGDFTCRFGGDEFLVVMPDASLKEALSRAEQWRVTMEKISTKIKGTRITVTISSGIASFPRHGTTVDEVLTAADDALYVAKASGRNCVVTSTHVADRAPA